MRKLVLAVVALMACAASPVGPQSGSAALSAEPPPAVQFPPRPSNPAIAESVPAAPKTSGVANNVPINRFSFNRVDDGFLRIDNLTGQIAYCSQHAVGWACQTVAEDRAAPEKEIARLQSEVARLEAQVAALREPPPRPPADSTPAPANARLIGQTPSMNDKHWDTGKLREDLERARLALENAWRLLVDMIINLQKDMMRKG